MLIDTVPMMDAMMNVMHKPRLSGKPINDSNDNVMSGAMHGRAYCDMASAITKV